MPFFVSSKFLLCRKGNIEAHMPATVGAIRKPEGGISIPEPSIQLKTNIPASGFLLAAPSGSLRFQAE